VKLLTKVARNAIAQDWLLLLLHGYLLLRALPTHGQDDGQALLYAAGLSCAFVVLLCLTRGELLRWPHVRAATYRVGLMGFVFAGYSLMSTLLPALRLSLLDSELLAIDQALFGQTLPALLEPFLIPGSVEWFSFFYFSYYWLLPGFGLHAMLRHGGQRLAELSTGVVIVAAAAYVLYTLVPAMGPFIDYPFATPLEGGFWWRQVSHVVAILGAKIDIFPSLHTAFPCLFALHAIRHRDRYRWVWPLLAFQALNITVATVFLRWHYGIDTLAGILLALSAHFGAIAVARREQQRGGKQQPFEPIRAEPAPADPQAAGGESA